MSETFDIASVMKEVAPNVRERLVVEVEDQLVASLRYQIQDEIKKYTSEYVKNELMPTLVADIDANKAALLEEMQEAIDSCFSAAAKAMKEKAEANLEQSWNLKKVVEGMFG